MTTPIDPPLVGHWPFVLAATGDIAFPSVVSLGLDGAFHRGLDGVDVLDRGARPGLVIAFIFRRARLSERRNGAIGQYREHRSRDSMHLHVLADRTWRIDHTDDFNPDAGPWSAFRHLLADHPLGKLLGR